MKRLLDVTIASLGLLVTSPFLVPVMLWIYLTDWHLPFYVAPRVGKDGRMFGIVKLRSMVVRADATGVDSTSATDLRITRPGQFIRRYKLDELPQLWNVLKGDMSLVGPRPNVSRGTELYTCAEKRLLSVKPGITDLASIIFADEGEILRGRGDADIAYNQLIRPWKSRLGLIYVDNQSLRLDLLLIWLTLLALLSRERALRDVQRLLADLNAAEELRRIAARREPLVPHPPPGATKVVMSSGARPV